MGRLPAMAHAGKKGAIKMLSAFRNFALTFLLAAIIFGVIAYFIVGFVLDTLAVTISAEPADETYELVYNTETEPPETTGPIVEEDPIEGDTFNILLIGTDYQPDLFDDYDYESKWTGSGFPDRRSRKWGADMIIVARIDKENRKFIFCALPRNTRVMVDGLYIQLGDVYAEKGADFMCGVVTGLTGLEMDYYAALDVGSIASVVDTLGGVSYYVPEDMNYEDPEQNLKIELKKGTTTLNGAKAAQLLRYVGYTGGATARMNTAISFLQAMLAKFTNVTYLTKAPELYKQASRYVTTNFTSDDLLNNIDLIFSYSKFEAVTVNYPGSAKAYEGVTFFDPSITSALSMFDQYK